MAQATIGISSAQIVASGGTPDFRLGTIGGYDNPTNGYTEFVYGQASGAMTGAGYGATETTGFVFTMVTSTTAAGGTSGYGSRFGAAQAVMATGDYGWFQIYGKGSLRLLASCVKGTRLNTTATAGALDDDGGASQKAISGIVLQTTVGGSAATSTDVIFSYPSVAETL